MANPEDQWFVGRQNIQSFINRNGVGIKQDVTVRTKAKDVISCVWSIMGLAQRANMTAFGIRPSGR